MAFHLSQDIGDMVFIADEGIGGGHSRNILGEEKLLMKALCSRYRSLHLSSFPQSLLESRHHSPVPMPLKESLIVTIHRI